MALYKYDLQRNALIALVPVCIISTYQLLLPQMLPISKRFFLAFSSQIQIQLEVYFCLRLISFSFLCNPHILPCGKMLLAAAELCLPFMAISQYLLEVICFILLFWVCMAKLW